MGCVASEGWPASAGGRARACCVWCSLFADQVPPESLVLAPERRVPLCVISRCTAVHIDDESARRLSVERRLANRLAPRHGEQGKGVAQQR